LMCFRLLLTIPNVGFSVLIRITNVIDVLYPYTLYSPLFCRCGIPTTIMYRNNRTEQFYFKRAHGT